MPAYSGMWTLSQVAQAIKNNNWTGVPPSVVEYLIVAGGGGGGWVGNSSGAGGGGGAGGLLQGYAGIIPGSSYYVTIGAGGTSTSSSNSNGGNSVFDSASSGASTGRIVATGGGYGGAGNTSSGANGGSGGGGQYSTAGSIAGAGITGQGNPGGIGAVNASPYNGGGGGGAGTVGLPTTASSGGAGIASSIVGSKVVYAGGGGGGSQTTAGVGGIGGGGSGGTANTAGVSATPNTGGGGGGAGNSGVGSLAGGTGGSGIVVIRYPGNVQYFTGGTLNYSNGFMVHTFYSSGTLAPTTPRLFASPDYQIARSLRFNSADSANLTRTLTTATFRNRWTWSGWVKRSSLDSGGFQTLFSSSDGAIGNDFFGFNQATFRLGMYGGTYILQSAVQYRDPAAWHHIVVAVDTTQSTDTDRAKVYINGVQITAWGTAGYPPQNYSCSINGAYAHQIGAVLSSSYSSMMLTEVNFVDGQQLTPASFGYTEPSTEVWTPLQYTGSYGTNGFYLKFSDNSNTTAATLGADSSGNSNNWTPNNFSITAGAGNDSLVDTPTNYGVDTGAGGEVRGNYATWNPLNADTTYITLSDGNLTYQDTTVGGSFQSGITTMFASSGKWYAEFTMGTFTTGMSAIVGIASPPPSGLNFYIEQSVAGYAGYGYYATGSKVSAAGSVGFGATYTTGDVISVAVDIDNSKVWFAKNGVWQDSGNPSGGTAPAYTIASALSYGFACGNGGSTNSSIIYANFGQRAFAYTAPSGFKALCSQNLPTSILPQTAFAVNAFIGSNSSRIIGTGIQSDLVLTKRRDSTYAILWHDALRGAGRTLYGNDTIAEVNNGGSYIQTFNSDSYGIGGADQALNVSSGSFVSWTWNAGGTTVTNTTGGISAQVRANPAAGFSIVTYTGTNTPSTIGHGLTTTPSLIIVKRRDSGSTNNWIVYHSTLGATKYLYLNTTAAADTWVGFWNNTSPTSSVFTIGNDGATNANGGTYVAYCWAEVPGFSRFSSYTGNGAADGPFVYTGFRPRWIMIKSTGTESWGIWDSVRNDYNFADDFLLAQSNAAEQNGPQGVDFLSNGFKVRGNYAINNTSGQAYIFAAFAESPLKYARAR